MEKELKKLSRLELLELLLAQQEEHESLFKNLEDSNFKLRAMALENEELKAKLKEKPAIDEKMIEEKYRVIYSQRLKEVDTLKENASKMSEALVAQTKEKCRKLILDTKKDCQEMLENAKKDVERAKNEEKKIIETPSFLTMARIILNDSEKFEGLFKDEEINKF